MRILITGSNGMLGSDLVAELAPYEICGLDRHNNRHSQIQYEQVDITDRTAVLKAVTLLKPSIIVHAAAFTDVDECELNPTQAFSVNSKGTQWVAEAGDSCGATLFFMSTDYVFDGTKQLPYNEEDKPNPLSVYGRSKFQAEEFLKSKCRSSWILRTSWLFGMNGKNFFRTIAQLAREKKELRIVDDQRGVPTYTKDLAKAIRILIERGSRAKGYHLYHIANTGETTWFQAAKKFLEKTSPDIKLIPISSQELNRPAKRPLNSVFNMERIKKDFGIQLRRWDEALLQFQSEVLKKE
ncbi:MAG: dTDP-4-dehydrorhamnose reductase [Omnitrophica bacterium RIFCSPHIGHO2_02_FULL_46_11]|nr:MAG: dTDP-4-dehydrorhamnose reductase [Omnitrophica bacterium RIFCSPHIGHO2_02_FULL_46_11]